MEMQDRLYDLGVYQLARKLSKIAWEIYEQMDWQTKKIIGNQFIESIDSIGANIAEGYGRYHYLDKIKFFYNSRGSYCEAALHWTDLLLGRNIIDKAKHYEIKEICNSFIVKLNNFIKSLYDAKNRS